VIVLAVLAVVALAAVAARRRGVERTQQRRVESRAREA
jgi:hypothetical protein